MTEAENPRRIRSFVVRAGRMTQLQQRGYDEGWPKYGLALSPDTPQLLDLTQCFGRSAPLVFEIGFGMGQSLAEMAAAETDKNFIGVEVHRPGVGKLLSLIDEKGLTNLRLYEADAVEVLAQAIPDGSISRFQLYFPDPWHKKRHHKRRLVQPAFIDKLMPKLADGGVIHMATDWEHYAEHMMEVLTAAPGLSNQAGEYAFSERPDWRPITKFERRGERLGHGVWDLIFSKDVNSAE